MRSRKSASASTAEAAAAAASPSSRAARLLRTIALFASGLTILSLGYALILRSGLGNDTIGVLAHGLALQTGLTIGNGSQLINCAALLIVLVGNRKLIGPGTVISAISIGFILDLFMALIPAAAGAGMQWLYLLLGSAIGGAGIAVTISSKFGASPIDTLMLLLAEKSRLSLRVVRILLDVCLAVSGWLLGGLLGLGTVITALCIGPIIQLALRLWMKTSYQR